MQAYTLYGGATYTGNDQDSIEVFTYVRISIVFVTVYVYRPIVHNI